MIRELKYLKNGYLDVRDIIENGNTFTFCTGGRGTGKTYGATEYIAQEYSNNKDHQFIMLRRRGTESDAISSPETNPFLPLTTTKGSKWYKKEVPFTIETLDSKSGVVGFRSQETGEIAGYLLALTTFYKVKSVPFPLVDLVFYDEFIPMEGSARVKNEYNTFCNMYETVNRNRELEGEKPCKVICMSNAETLGNAVYMGLSVIDTALKMQKDGREVYNDNDRGITLLTLRNSPISEKKRKTALYKLNSKSTYVDKALNNNFLYDDRLVKSKNLSGYKCILKVGELLIYKHKSSGEYYVKVGKNKGVYEYLTTDEDLKRFQARENYLWIAYIRQRIYFETYESQVILLIYMNF